MFAAAHQSAVGRFCCKSLFGPMIAEHLGQLVGLGIVVLVRRARRADQIDPAASSVFRAALLRFRFRLLDVAVTLRPREFCLVREAVAYADRQVYALDVDFTYSRHYTEKPRRGAELVNDLHFLRTKEKKGGPTITTLNKLSALNSATPAAGSARAAPYSSGGAS
jgi:hypothetical protein